ncbi:MAG: AAA family ATPase [Nitrososphaerales archaeon]
MTQVRASQAPLLPIAYDMDLFVDRESEIASIKEAINNKLNVLLIGDYGSGKTTLLNRISYMYRETKNLMFVSIVLPWETNSPSDLVHLLLSATLRKIAELPSQKVKGVVGSLLNDNRAVQQVRDLAYSRNLSVHSPEMEYDALNRFVDAVSIVQKTGRSLVFLIDETDKIPEKIYKILGSLRESLWKTKSTFIFSGNLNAEGMYLKPPLETFFDVVVELKPLNFDDMKRLIISRVGPNKISDSEFRRVFEASGGVPRSVISIVQSQYLRQGEQDQSGVRVEKVRSGPLGSLATELGFQRKLLELDVVSREILRYIEKNGATYSSDAEFQHYMRIKRSALVRKLHYLLKLGLLRRTYDRSTRRQLYSLNREAYR